jgi:hypothetical protein
MRFHVLFGGMLSVLCGIGVMTVSEVRVMCRLLMIAALVMLRRFVVVVCSLRVVRGSLRVMMRCFL